MTAASQRYLRKMAEAAEDGDDEPQEAVEEDKWVKMEREHNRIPEGDYSGIPYWPEGRPCDHCGETRIDSVFLHRHVCPDIPEHRENYPTARLERELLGEESDQ